MTVTSVQKDPKKLTLTITADFEAGVDRVWQMWADPRLLEKWWGPPTYPATFEDHDLTAGGVVTYFMTGPDGEQPRGIWHVAAVEEPHYIEFEDAFAGENGEANPEMPVTRSRVEISQIDQSGDATRMTIASTFASAEAMEQLIEMGMEEGAKLAVGQIDDLL
jgi:uncharacterized protein YndB with AHSA1/START domain